MVPVLFVLLYGTTALATASEPYISPGVDKGILIDAGYDYSTLHIFVWQPRLFADCVVSTSFPRIKKVFSRNFSPGIGEAAQSEETLVQYLTKMIFYAKTILESQESVWSSIPLYLVATDAVRSMPPEHRKFVIERSRSLLGNRSLSPFLPLPSGVAILPGNQQAAYTWISVNLAEDTRTFGRHKISSSQQWSLGSVFLGDTSTQIAFGLSAEGTRAGLYRVQIGSDATLSWSLYTHSYGDLGFEPVRARHLATAADEACADISPDSAVVPRALDYCFFAGYSESVLSFQKPRRLVEIHGPSVPAGDQLRRCMASLEGWMGDKRTRSSCKEVHGRECGLQGTYQPLLPQGKFGHFVGSGLFRYPWQLLKLDSGGPISLSKFREKAEGLCSMSFSDLVLYDAGLVDVNKDHKHTTLLPYSCFLSSYALVLLQGYGFGGNNTLSVTHASPYAQPAASGADDGIDTQDEVDWVLGFLLTEVNSYPWQASEREAVAYLGKVMLALVIGVIAGTFSTGFLARRIFGSEAFLRHRSNSLSPHINRTQHTVNVPDEGSGVARPPSWPNKITQFNPFRRQGYELIDDNGSAL